MGECGDRWAEVEARVGRIGRVRTHLLKHLCAVLRNSIRVHVQDHDAHLQPFREQNALHTHDPLLRPCVLV